MSGREISGHQTVARHGCARVQVVHKDGGRHNVWKGSARHRPWEVPIRRKEGIHPELPVLEFAMRLSHYGAYGTYEIPDE